MNKKWFAFKIFMLMFSSVVTFLYLIALYTSQFFMIPGISKELMTVAILTGIFIGTAMMYFSIKALYHHGTKVTINMPTQTFQEVTDVTDPRQQK